MRELDADLISLYVWHRAILGDNVIHTKLGWRWVCIGHRRFVRMP